MFFQYLVNNAIKKYNAHKVTSCECQPKDGETRHSAEQKARKQCSDNIITQASGIATANNITGLGEGVIGVSAGGADAIMVASGVGVVVTGGWVLVAVGVVIAGKGLYDIYMVKSVWDDMNDAISKFCDCDNLVDG